MRFTHYDSRPCIAMWTSPPSMIAEIVPSNFGLLVRQFKIGKGSLKRELVHLSSDDFNSKSKKTIRRSCIGIFLDDLRWPTHLKERIRNGKKHFLIYMILVICTSMFV